QGLDGESLRGAGRARQKAAYLKDLSAQSLSGVLSIERLHELEDEEVISQLTAVKGVGRWTAQMFLQFRLHRPDVLSELDLGIRRAIQNLYALDQMPAFAQVQQIGEKWSPYRSIASWYLWRSLE